MNRQVQLHPGVVALFYSLALGAYLSRVVAEPGHFFQLALGNALASSGELPVRDSWTVIGEGMPWRWAGWLYGLLLSLSETRLGEAGVAWFIMGAGWVCTTLLLFSFKAVSRSYFFAGLIATLVAVGALEGSSIGPMHFGLAGLAAILAASQERLTPGRAAVLFAAMALSANMSDIGAAVLVGALVMLPRMECAVPLVLGAVATPYFGSELLQQISTEWPARLLFELETRGNLPSVFDYGFAILLLISLVVAILIAARGPVLRGREIIVVLSSILFGMIYKPALPYASVLLAYCAMRLWCDAPEGSTGELGASIVRLRSGLARLPSVGTTWILLVLIIINVKKFMQEPVVPVLLPTRALDYILDHRLPGPVLHEMAVGGYVAYRFAHTREPRQRAYLDPRVVYLDPRSAKQESAMAKLGEGWRGLFERVPPETVVVRTKTALWELLKREPGWNLAYQDDLATAESEGRVLEIPFGWAVFTRSANVESAGKL